MNLSSIFPFCFLFLLFLASADLDADLGSLLEFKKGIQDPLSRFSPKWDRSVEPSTWPGVTIDPNSGSVIGVDLSGLGLYGDLKFSTLTPLKNLRNLSLSGNAFTGRLVPALGTMSMLQYLDLSNNGFIGTIPGRITELYGLSYLNLSLNKFEGGFPSGFRNLQNLRVLDLHNNSIWGDIGDLLSELRNVEHVDLSCNQFYGGLPGSMDNISSMANTVRYVNLSHNQLNGGFFSGEEIALFRNLEVLDLGGNQISGELPSFGTLPGLRVLRLGNNELFGALPVELLEGALPLLELDLSGNGFTGSIDLINSTSLNTLSLSRNQISGDLPSTVKSCLMLDLSGNMISGDISVMQNWEASVEILDLSSNKLKGNLENLTSHFEGLTMLNIGNNNLAGTLPSLLNTFPRLTAVDLSLNQISGNIPGSFFSSLTLKSLNLSGNHFSGSIPLQGSRVNELLVLPPTPQIESLDLSSNSLVGVLPSRIGDLERLTLLNLSHNELSGELPSDLNKLTLLEYLDLSGNHFQGKIPEKLSSRLIGFNVSNNNLSGPVPANLNFSRSSFSPGNGLLIFPKGLLPSPDRIPDRGHHRSKGNIRLAIIAASVVAAMMVAFFLFAYHRAHHKEFKGRGGFVDQTSGTDAKAGRFSRPSLFNFHSNIQHPPSSLSFSNDHLLTSNSRSLSGQQEFVTEIVEHNVPQGAVTSSASTYPNLLDDLPATSGRKSSPGSPLPSSPSFIEACEQPAMLDVNSPDRLAGELFFVDSSLAFTIEELSRAPAEVLGRSSHGTLYKATLRNGYVLTVKWLRVGLVKNKKDFAKEVKKIGSIRHPNFVPLRAYYWGPREQERLLLADYIQGDSLALHLYETTPRRYSPLSFSQRLKVAIEVARCLLFLHDRGLAHGNLKPTNIILAGPDYHPWLTDYCLHRLMTSSGIAEQVLNLGALGYRAPELATASKPALSPKSDVYAFGVILMELLTRKSAGDIISGQSGAVDLTDWVRLCDQEGRGMDCIDRDIASGEEHTKGMDDLLGISLRCILGVNERPNMRQVLDDLGGISV